MSRIAQSITIDNTRIAIEYEDGSHGVLSLSRFPELASASETEKQNWSQSAEGISWPDLGVLISAGDIPGMEPKSYQPGMTFWDFLFRLFTNRTMWAGISLVVAAAVVLSVFDLFHMDFSDGPVFRLGKDPRITEAELQQAEQERFEAQERAQKIREITEVAAKLAVFEGEWTGEWRGSGQHRNGDCTWRRNEKYQFVVSDVDAAELKTGGTLVRNISSEVENFSAGPITLQECLSDAMQRSEGKSNWQISYDFVGKIDQRLDLVKINLVRNSNCGQQCHEFDAVVENRGNGTLMFEFRKGWERFSIRLKKVKP